MLTVPIGSSAHNASVFGGSKEGVWEDKRLVNTRIRVYVFEILKRGRDERQFVCLSAAVQRQARSLSVRQQEHLKKHRIGHTSDVSHVCQTYLHKRAFYRCSIAIQCQ